MKKNVIAIFVTLLLGGFSMMSTPAFAAELGGVDIHGFVSQGFLLSNQYNYLTNDSKDGSFQYNELGINFAKALTDNLRLGIQLFSRDLGDVANNKVTVDWAYGDYRIQDWFGIRAGRIKLPLGLYNETRDVDLLRTSVVMPQSVYNDLLRDTQIAANGASIYGNVDISALGSLEYQFLAGQMNIDNDSGYQKYYESRYPGLILTDDPDTGISYVGNLRWNTPVDGWLFGVSAMKSDFDNAVNITAYNLDSVQELSTTLFTLSTEFTWEDLVLAAEYQTFEAKSDMAVTGHTENTSEGYYVSASYRFSALFTLGAYYSVFYPNKDDKEGTLLTVKSDAWEKDLALTLRFDINDYIVFKIEGHSVDGTARVNSTDNEDRTEDDFYYGVAKVTFSF
jgi:hypothetical protein